MPAADSPGYQPLTAAPTAESSVCGASAGPSEPRQQGPPSQAGDPPSSGKDRSKSILELLIAPATLAVITAIVGYYTNQINARTQKAEADRAFRASQIDAVMKLMPGTGAADARLYAPRLAAYGDVGVPLLTAALIAQSDSEQVSAIERGLIQLGVISHGSDAVGKAMGLILEDRWKLYTHTVHQSAMRVISAVCYSRARAILSAYTAEDVVQKKDWQDVLGNQSLKSDFDECLTTARAVADSCALSETISRLSNEDTP